MKAAMQYFVQAFCCRNPYPDKYDLLMDIATEELGHLEIVGATLQMLLTGVNGELKDAADRSEIMKMMEGKATKENFIQQAMFNPHFLVLSGGAPMLTDCNGNPWSAMYVNADGDPTVDFRSNIAAESRAKIVYEYLLKFTDDPYVIDTLTFLMTREVAHFQQFEAALETIKPNFPPGVLQSDPRYSNIYYNTSEGEDARGPWNEGVSSRLKETWQYVDDPRQQVDSTNGLTDIEPMGTDRTLESVAKMDRKLSKERSEEVNSASPMQDIQWCSYPDSPKEKKDSRMRG